MKNITTLICAAVFTVMMTGCDAINTLTRSKGQTSQGRPYELIVVCPQADWDGAMGDTLRSVFLAPVPYLNRKEPIFDLLRVNERSFTGMIAAHRNILKIVEDPTLAEAEAGVQYDVNSEPQIVMTLQGHDSKSITTYLSINRENIVRAFEQAERDRTIAYAERYGDKVIEDVILKKFNFEMNVPKGYVLANQTDDFIWARYEFPQSSQGFFIYSYPYKGTEALSPEALLAARNKYAARIPGALEGTYMTTSPEFEPDYRMFRMEGRVWCELRGFWDVEGDYMGGPFVSYTTVDTATNRVVTLDCYIYSPRNHQRNLMHGVENLFYTVKFPVSDKTEPQQAH